MDRGQTKSHIDSAVYGRLLFVKASSPRANPDILKALARNDGLLARFGIFGNNERMLQFLSECAVETYGFRTLSENLDYSKEALRRIFGSRIDTKTAAVLAHKPREIADYVYGNRLGNRPDTDDGWNFRGAGYLQITGRSNFRDLGKQLGIPIQREPELVRAPPLGLDAALAYWRWKGLNVIADTADVRSVRLRVNGGLNGLDAATIWYQVLRKNLAKQEGFSLEARRRGGNYLDRALSNALFNMGFLDRPALEGLIDNQSLSRALLRFQIARGLSPTGKFDTQTLYSITDPLGRFPGDWPKK